MATFYDYENRTALDPYTGAGAPNAVGQVFAKTDTTFSTPLTVVLMGSGLQATDMTTDQYSQLPGFQVDGHLQVVFKSGDFTKVLNTTTPLVGPQGPAVAEAVDNGDGTVTFKLEDGTNAATVALPEGPAGPYGGTEITDPQLTSLLTTPGTQTNTVFSTTTAKAVARSLSDDRVKKMAAVPPATPPVMASPPTITEGTLPAGLTKQYAGDSPVFLWDGPTTTSIGTTPRYYTNADGSGAAASRPSARIAFETDADQFAIRVIGRTNMRYRLWVNEEATQTNLINVTNTSGGSTYISVNFGSYSAAPRRIVFEIDSGSAIQFYGIYVKPAALVTKLATKSPRVMLVGDSYGAGANATYYLFGYGRTLARLMGWADMWTHFTSVPSTGLIKTASATVGNYKSRLAGDVIPYDPDIVIIQGSINDKEFAGQNLIGPALTDYVNTLKAAVPGVLVIATGILRPAAWDAGQTNVNNELRTASAALGVPFVDLSSPAPVFTGTGTRTTPTGDGNADRYIDTDGSHPTTEGHYALANILAGRLSEIVGATAV